MEGRYRRFVDALFALAGHSRGSVPLDVLAGLALLSVAPFVLVLTTSFVRIVVVLSLVRSALGTASLPPNTVLTGLALVLTFVIMTPTWSTISRDALEPYVHGRIGQPQFFERATAPLAGFMRRQTRRADVVLFAKIARVEVPARTGAVPLTVLLPAFVVGELRSAFAIGVALYLPFVAIDLAVARDLDGSGHVHAESAGHLAAM